MAIVKTNSQNYSSIANAIRAKGVSGTFYPSEMATAISNIPTGAPEIPERGVVFIDYDGTVIDVWDASEVAGKTALPANPTGHTRLVAEGWNWTLNDIKSYIASFPKAVLTVGQTYHTVSGKTELDITVTKAIGTYVTCNISGEKDWGDGTINTSSSHDYTDYGNYTIKCSGTTFPSSNVFGSTGANVNSHWCTAAFIGNGVTSIGSAFNDCFSLSSVTIPSSVNSIGSSVLDGCYSLTSVTIPNGITGFTARMVEYCHSLTSIAIPKSVTNIEAYAFYNCHSLTSITIPNSITSIGAYAFNGCYAIIKYDFSAATAVPTLSDTNAFTGIKKICKIVVPDALYSSWRTATNWSTYASYIYKVSEVTD